MSVVSGIVGTGKAFLVACTAGLLAVTLFSC